MTEQTGAQPSDLKRDRLVIVASSLGTVFEWYDFFLYGILAALIGRLFFPIDNPTAATLASLATFGAGFGVRPLGAMLFGHYGDRIGRKYTFLVTITLMGGATALIGLLPTYASAGLWAPALLVGLRLLQGLALGGEYGGAAIYVGEHAPKHRRGEYTSWIQISVVGGFLLCLIVVLATRAAMTPEQFDAWGWRIPFLLSLLMLAISIYIRMQLSESPVFQQMKAAGKTAKNPLKEAFSDKTNIGNVLVALFGVAAGLTVIYYTSQFGTLYFLTGTAGVGEREALIYLAIGALVAAPFYVGFGMLSDRIGRKKLLLIGYALSMLLLFPLFHLMANGANPALARATAANPVTLELPDCEFRIFARTQTEECAKALGFLTKRGIAYTKQEAPAVALVVGDTRVEGFDEAKFAAALKAAGYPEKADPAEKQRWKIILAVFAMVALSAMTYGQVAAILVELFPARVRYTSMSVPYHIGTGYFGGFLPFIQQLIVVNTGNPFSGLWYTIGVVAMAFVVSAIWLPETKDRDITA
ncbi:MHS family MFS transporter [Sandaracinobacter neustonicus]|uniref:MHS family MFS transporter n=1 Tax=Sandaracinobacter neustonicus TaxID=1715348 RepID=A0A501XNB7_9SPHN|nr:MFS transporter [Sandaracinobacter neustonicus]TPE62161.1 MHS family MFS transporter [Sandaracinobacter neustonicus]